MVAHTSNPGPMEGSGGRRIVYSRSARTTTQEGCQTKQRATKTLKRKQHTSKLNLKDDRYSFL